METNKDIAIEDTSQLIQYFQEGTKPKENWKIGIEVEILGTFCSTGKSIPYFGDKGIATVMQSMSRDFGWQEVKEKDNLIELRKGKSRITLEPGGQYEFSGAAFPSIHDVEEEFKVYVEEIKQVAEPLDVCWLGIGLFPFDSLDELAWVPKKRYKIMRDYLAKKGKLSHVMMKSTAAIQASIDYLDEEDAGQKMRLAMGLSPVVTAMTANSPFSAGKPNGFMSKRAHAWLYTDDDRCGLIQDAFSKDLTFRDYVSYALNVPTFFIMRDNNWIFMDGVPFGKFIKDGHKGYKATMNDWKLHLTTIFTEARMKDYIEMRSTDCLPPSMVLSVPAFWKGIMYDENSAKNAWRLVKNWSWEERLQLREEVPKHALQTKIKDVLFLDIAKELLSLSEEGLKRQACARQSARARQSACAHQSANSNLTLKDETKYLQPLKNFIFEKEKCPARFMLEMWENDWRKDKMKLIEYCKY